MATYKRAAAPDMKGVGSMNKDDANQRVLHWQAMHRE
jgi:hypothetical protein